MPACPRAPCHRAAPSSLGLALLGMALLGLALASAGRVLALEGDQDQPIFVEADSVELDDIKAPERLHRQRPDRSGQHAHPCRPCDGPAPRGSPAALYHSLGNPVRYRQDVEGEKGEVNAHAQRMEYDADKDELTLIDQAELTQAADRFASDRIVYDRAHTRVQAGASAQGGQGQDHHHSREETAKRRKAQPAPKAGERRANASTGPGKAAPAVSMLEAPSLTKRYGRRHVLHGVSVCVDADEVVGLLGPNGAGKTTCFYLIVGTDRLGSPGPSSSRAGTSP